MDACAALAAAPLFRGAAPSDFDPLARHIIEREFARGTYLWHQGDPATSAFLIVAGEVTAARVGPDGEEYVVEVFLAGDIMGQLPLFDERPGRLMHAKAAVPTRCLVIPLDALRRLVEERPQLLLPMVIAYSRWLRQRDATASETAFRNLSGKIACKLLELQALTGTQRDTAIPIDLPQARLAGMVGASRENVNRALARLVARGEVRKLGRQLQIVDPDEFANRYSWAISEVPDYTPH